MSKSLAEAAQAFVARLDAIHADDQYRIVWELNHIRNGPYTGPQYTDELEALRQAIVRTPTSSLSEDGARDDLLIERLDMAARTLDILALDPDYPWAKKSAFDVRSGINRIAASQSTDLAKVVEALEPFMPISVNETPDYAELTFGEHQTQAMTMDPTSWLALDEAFRRARQALASIKEETE